MLFALRFTFNTQTLRLCRSARQSVLLLRTQNPQSHTTASTPHIRAAMSSSKSGKSAQDVGSTELIHATTLPFIVKFYDPNIAAADSSGRTLETMLEWEDRKLEQKHDYIQIWFPLPEGSPFNWAAPVIDQEICSAFRSRLDLRANLQKAFTRILSFYGFEASYVGEDVQIHRRKDYITAFRNWVVRFDHNHLRITRIIRSLRVLGLEQNAQAFYNAIQDVNRDFPDQIGTRSIMYWKRAAIRQLSLPPDEDDDSIKGQRFLRELDEAAVVKRTLAPEAIDLATQVQPVESKKSQSAGVREIETPVGSEQSVQEPATETQKDQIV